MGHPMEDGQPGQAASGVNPYVQARREWNERYGDYIAQARNWRLVALVAVTGMAVLGGGWVWNDRQSRYIPYVVEVDKLGRARAVAPVEASTARDPRVIKAGLWEWIENARSVYVDAAAGRRQIDEAFGFVASGSAAHQMLRDYYAGHDPFVRAQTETVSVQVQSVLPISADTWRGEWREIRRGRDGAVIEDSQWQATMTISVSPPEDADAFPKNPAGIYITALSWARRS